MTKIFGPRMRETEGYELVPAPLYEPCQWCEELIESDDNGFMIASIDGFVPYHRECFLRTIIGSVAHQLRTCSCFVPGSTCSDPPDQTKREAAKWALQIYEWRRELTEVMEQHGDLQ